MKIRAGSFCSGMEVASQALGPLGFHMAFAAEVEAFPCGVLGYRFGATAPRHFLDPSLLASAKERKFWEDNNRELTRMVARGDFSAPGNGLTNIGDFTKLDVEEWLDVEWAFGGPPCQSFSIAGRRKGLKDNRGNLTLTYVDKLHDLAANGSLRGAVYENVPGLLSDKSNAFGCFLGAIVGHDAPIKSPHLQGRWTDVGVVVGPRARAAWRILDTQHFGLPQRRRRLFVVICFDPGLDPVEILFEPEGVLGPAAPCLFAEEDLAGIVAPRPGVDSEAGDAGGRDVAGTITAVYGGRSAEGAERGALVTEEIQSAAVAGTLLHGGRAAGSATSQDAENGLLVTVAIAEPQIVNFELGLGPHGSMELQNVSPALSASEGKGKTAVVYGEPISFNARQDPIPQTGQTGQMGPIDTDGYSQAIAYAPELSPTLKADGFDGSEDGSGRRALIAHVGPIAFNSREDLSHSEEVFGALGASHPQAQAVAFSVRGRDGEAQVEAEAGDVMPALRTGGGGSDKAFVAHVAETVRWMVRRLLPEECESLQGVEQGFTKIPWRGKPADECPDGPRYKVIGNAFSKHVIMWLGRRIIAAEKKRAAAHG